MNGVVGVIAIVIGFTAWFFLSMFLCAHKIVEFRTNQTIAIAILVCMEGTSAMLHSLRLAWVESFSKFAEFGGWPFAPFSFDTLLEESEDLKEYLG
jgi:V-type H+-transporting ATPase subunit a